MRRCAPPVTGFDGGPNPVEMKPMSRDPAPPKTRDDIALTLFDLFRRSGYDAVSIADISAATGLGKSSLYHHFPGGKPDMAEAVAAMARARMRDAVFDPLRGAGSAAKKIAAMTAFVSEMYDGGGAPCLISSLMISPNAGPAAIDAVRAIMTEWIDALADALRAEGLPAAEARRRALDALITIQGGLVVARATGDQSVFARAMAAAKRDLLMD
jgi:AcrR family transcriptional regulator